MIFTPKMYFIIDSENHSSVCEAPTMDGSKLIGTIIVWFVLKLFVVLVCFYVEIFAGHMTKKKLGILEL